MNQVLAKIFGSRNQRLLRKMQREVARINALEPDLEKLDDDALKARTAEFRQRIESGSSLDELLPEAFATVREAARRVLGMRHFDVQMIGGMVLHQGRIAEMKTGEGKTLVATLAVYLNALPGKGVHVVTVNDYLAARDAEWMGKLYRFLGLSVGVVVAGQTQDEKRAAYAADITYGTNNEFGFDYLRDNMAFSSEDRVQRDKIFAVVDEVDSILIDEARTPLIISGPTDDDPELYRRINTLIPKLKPQLEEDGPGHYSVDEKARQVHFTEEGHEYVEEMLQQDGLLSEGQSLYDAQNIVLMHHLTAALRAHTLFNRDVEYIVHERQIVIVDEFTGRTMPGRRWSDGLHQAVEAKEGVPIQQENQTLASITFQNYFRLYDKLSGMTGTADTEAFEFQQIYGLEVVVIPTNRPMQRIDGADLIYMNEADKFNAIVEEIAESKAKGQPVLVGTASIDTSERLSELLRKRNVEHEVLNAKQHEREADIIVHAGRPGKVTIATNMAGRGTDIVLGGNLEAELDSLGEDAQAERAKVRADWQARHDAVIASGGLKVIGSERHESRRIDNQLRGRSGRQGDPGETRFYLSLEDNLMRIFTPPRMRAMLQGLGMQQGEVIESKLVTRAIENAQRKVEARNFDIRKQLLEYDNVANDQRREIYALRDELMSSEDVSAMIADMRRDAFQAVFINMIPPQSVEEQWDVAGLTEALHSEYQLNIDVQSMLDADHDITREELFKRLLRALEEVYEAKESQVGASVMRHFEKSVMLQVLDTLWREHLAAMDYLRQGINLRSYAQRDPKQEYKREGFAMFSEMLERLKHDVITILSKVQVQTEDDVERIDEARRRDRSMQYQHDEAPSALEGEAPTPGADPAQAPRQAAGGRSMPPPVEKPETFVREGEKIGRNQPCPCGSGKKYKQCHGRLG